MKITRSDLSWLISVAMAEHSRAYKEAKEAQSVNPVRVLSLTAELNDLVNMCDAVNNGEDLDPAKVKKFVGWFDTIPDGEEVEVVDE